MNDRRDLPPDLSADPEQAERLAGGTQEGDLKPESAMLARLGQGSIEDRVANLENLVRSSVEES